MMVETNNTSSDNVSYVNQKKILFFIVFIYTMLCVCDTILFSQNKSLKLIFPDGFSTVLEKNKKLHKTYIIKNGIKSQVYFLNDWISDNKLQAYIDGNKIFKVIKSPVKNSHVNKSYFNGKDKITSNPLIPVISDSSFSYNPISIKSSNLNSYFSILTPEISPEINIQNSTVRFENINKSHLILTDNQNYDFWLNFKYDAKFNNKLIIKNVLWTFKCDDFTFKYFGNPISSEKLSIPNYSIDDKFKWSLSIRVEFSLLNSNSVYTDYFIERQFPLWIMDYTKPEFDINYSEVKTKYYNSDSILFSNIKISDNNINLPDNISDFKLEFYTFPKKISSKSLKTSVNIDLYKDIPKNRFLESSAYFSIDINKKMQISRNYEGPFQMSLKLSDLTSVYTYEIFSADICDNIPPFCEIMLESKPIVTKKFFNNKLLKKIVTVHKKFPKLISQKRYRFKFSFFDNIIYKYVNDKIIRLNNIKSVIIDNKKILLDKNFSFVKYYTLSKFKRIKLKIFDKNNNIRIVNININVSNQKFSVTNLQE